jgi:transcriptional regulator with XRE-family HTH domain
LSRPISNVSTSEYYRNVKTEFSKLLESKYLEWERKENQRKTVLEFSAHVGLGQKTISHLLNGNRPPSKKTAEHLAKFFRDPLFYDVAGMDRPGATTAYIRRNLGRVPPAIKKKIAEEVAQYSTEPLPKEGDEDGK